jgi:glucosamine 6-phosphate synthetase-like amidotransferase/phosphosugar isomerase protein
MIKVRGLCGVFGFILREPVEMVEVFNVLRSLEKHQYPGEGAPVGGFGAGVAILSNSGEVLLKKVGRVFGSPVEHLLRICEIQQASILIGHVRMPSPKPEFLKTAHLKETAQPYVVKCFPGLWVVSAHNGYMANYETVRQMLNKKHVFESEGKGILIDSEVIPHLFEELLVKEKSYNHALEKLFSTVEGSNTISLLQPKDGHVLLYLMHKGKTRGLHVWKNENEEVIFCSRKEPLVEHFSHVLSQRHFKEYVSIPYGVERSYKETFIFNLH